MCQSPFFKYSRKNNRLSGRLDFLLVVFIFIVISLFSPETIPICTEFGIIQNWNCNKHVNTENQENQEEHPFRDGYYPFFPWVFLLLSLFCISLSLWSTRVPISERIDSFQSCLMGVRLKRSKVSFPKAMAMRSIMSGEGKFLQPSIMAI